jgi:hypothetical protein
MQENNCFKLPQMSNQLWCWKNEQNVNMDYNLYNEMSLSKIKHYMKNTYCLFQIKFITEYTNVQHIIITQI